MKKLNFFSKIIAVTAIITTCYAGSIKAQTITEDFETGLPDAYGSEDYSSEYVLNSGVWTLFRARSTSTANGGATACQFATTTASGLISPTINNGVTSVSYYGRKAESAETKVRIDYSTNNGGTWTPGTSQTLSATYTSYSVDINTTVPTKIRFYRIASTPYIDDITITSPGGCSRTSALSYSAVTQNSATVSWTAEGEETSWEVQYKTTGAESWADAPNSPVSSPTITLTGLDANTSYDVQVRALCSESDKSDWRTGTSAFKTLCVANTVYPFVEGFESAAAPADCWTMYYKDGQSTPCNTSNLMTHNISKKKSGTQSFRFSSNYGSSCTEEQYLITPEMNFNGTGKLLKFYYTKYSSSTATDKIRVGVSTTDKSYTSFTWDSYINATNTSFDETSFVEKVLDANVKYVCIMYQGNYQYYIYIDDFSISELPACYQAPLEVIASDVTLSGATVSWTAPIYVPSNGYDIYVSTENTAPPADTEPAAHVSGTEYALTGTAYQTYYVWVRANCESVTSEWVGTDGIFLNTIPTLPYSTDFSINDGWFFANGSTANKWYIGSTSSGDYAVSGGLYISDDEGVTNNYASNTTYSVFAYKTINLTEKGLLDISYDWRCYGESYSTDFFRAFLVPADKTITAGVSTMYYNTTPTGWNVIDDGSSYYNRNASATADFTTKTKNITITSEGLYNIVFFWKNDIYTAQPPAAIDNFSISYHPKYTVTYNAGSGTCEEASATETIAGVGVELPIATPTCEEEGWSFAGWSEEYLVEETDSRPTFLTSPYLPTENTTIYAVYKKGESVIVDTQFELVTSSSQLQIDNEYIISAAKNNASTYQVAMAAVQYDEYYMSQKTITWSGAKIDNAVTNAGVWTLVTNDNNYAFKNGSNYLSSTYDKVYLILSPYLDANSRYSITFNASTNIAKINAQVDNDRNIDYNESTSFRTYKRTPTSAYLFVKSPTDVDAYTYHSTPCAMIETYNGDIEIETLSLGIVDLHTNPNGTSTAQFRIDGKNLDETETIEVSSDNPLFTLEAEALPAGSPSRLLSATSVTEFLSEINFLAVQVPKTITVKYAPTEAGDHLATINVSYADGEIEKEIIISGSATNIVTGLETAVIVRTIYARGQEIFV
ncbi:MAG: fibronectin type III domain-containing protein, partial [Prevotellaceae bacterium]|nr:fibronectin type III domain-containing protein [Prevotellaceae bacterium]